MRRLGGVGAGLFSAGTGDSCEAVTEASINAKHYRHDATTGELYRAKVRK